MSNEKETPVFDPNKVDFDYLHVTPTGGNRQVQSIRLTDDVAKLINHYLEETMPAGYSMRMSTMFGTPSWTLFANRPHEFDNEKVSVSFTNESLARTDSEGEIDAQIFTLKYEFNYSSGSRSVYDVTVHIQRLERLMAWVVDGISAFKNTNFVQTSEK